MYDITMILDHRLYGEVPRSIKTEGIFVCSWYDLSHFNAQRCKHWKHLSVCVKYRGAEKNILEISGPPRWAPQIKFRRPTNYDVKSEVTIAIRNRLLTLGTLRDNTMF